MLRDLTPLTVSLGTELEDCDKPGYIALSVILSHITRFARVAEYCSTFDDGPYMYAHSVALLSLNLFPGPTRYRYTDELLDLLEEKNVKATFFITYVWPPEMVLTGHAHVSSEEITLAKALSTARHSGGM